MKKKSKFLVTSLSKKIIALLPSKVIGSALNGSSLSVMKKVEMLCGSGLDDTLNVCDSEGNRKIDWSGLVVIFIGILLTGIGNCAFYSFGVAYLDDNTSHKNSPIMLSLTYTFRLLGPTLGFLLGTFCLKQYVYPGQTVEFEEGDPQWIGAWWLGFPIIGFLIFLFAGMLFKGHAGF